MPKRYRLNHHQLASELAKKRYSQNRWADVLDIGRGHLSLLVNGKRPYPSEDTRKKLLLGLDVPFSTLFEIEDVLAPGSDRPRHLLWIPRAEPPGIVMPLESTFQEVRYAARSLAQRPLFSLIVVAMLALGIGGNSAMFSWMDALLLRPLRVQDPERWVVLGMRMPSGFVASYSYPNYLDHVRMNEVFDELHAYRITPASLSAGTENLRTTAAIVSGGYFRALGGSAELGRTFNESEDEVPGRDAVAVISHGFWQRQFAGDHDIVGREVLINAHPFTLIGVMPEEFGFARLEPSIDLWAPLAMQEVMRPGEDTLESRGHGFLTVVGRLRPGLDFEAATAQFNDMHVRLIEQYPQALAGTSIDIQRATRGYLGSAGDSLALVFAVLMGVIGTVLLIACMNVANLLLARGADRHREISIRVALGASRARIVKQLLTESLLLSGAAAVLGVALASWINRLILSFQPPLPIPIKIFVGIDGRALAFTTLIAMATGLIFGTVPALRAASTNVVASLHGSGRVSSGNKLRNSLVVFQIATSLALLIGAGLFVRSLQNASSMDAGFRSDGVVVATLDPGLQGYSAVEAREFYRQLLGRTAALPGVESVALAEMLPMGLGSQQWGTRIDGYEPRERERMNLDYNFVSPGYFEALGIELVRGRAFTWDDTASATGAIIINETMARRYWTNGDAIGGLVQSVGMDRLVVGIVADAKYYTLGEEPMPFMYVPYEQSQQTALALHVRATDSFDAIVAAIRLSVSDLDAAMPIVEIRSLEEQMTVALLPARMTAGLLAVFGAFALFLAGVGLYGVMAYSVGQRTREIGIRMALGAGESTVLGTVIKSALALLGIGALFGLLAGIGLGQAAQGVLYGVRSTDPVALGAAVAVIMATVLGAAWIPARRATRVNPVEALRMD